MAWTVFRHASGEGCELSALSVANAGAAAIEAAKMPAAAIVFIADLMLTFRSFSTSGTCRDVHEIT
jgi:hypothetical protein